MAVTLKGYTANYLGLSTDTKPTEADDNAIFRELDTGKRYYFTGAAWAEIPSSGGGGGGVTSVNSKTGAVTLTASDVGAYTTEETDTLLGNKQDKTLSAAVKIGTESETTVEGAIGEVAAIIPETAAANNKLSTEADTAEEDIEETTNSEDISLTDAADARVQDLRIYGRTANGSSVGDNGLTVKADGGYNLWDEEWEPGTYYYYGEHAGEKNDTEQTRLRSKNSIKIDPTKAYFITISGRPDILVNIGFYDENRGWIGYNVGHEGGYKNEFIRIPTNAYYIVFWTFSNFSTAQVPYNYGITINLSNAEVNGKYFPYQKTNMIVSTALPLRGKLNAIDLGSLNWIYQTTANPGDPCSLPRFATDMMSVPDAYIPSVEFGVAMSSCSSRFTVAVDPVLGGNTDKTICFGKGKGVYAVDHEYTDAAAFKAAVAGIILTYPSYCDEIDFADGVAITRLDSSGNVLSTPVTTPLTDAEKAAFAEFRTFEGSTNITATDNPFMTLNYVKNTENGKALANVDNKVAGKVDKNGTDRLMTAAEGTKLAGIETEATKNAVIDTTCTLTVAGWTGADVPYTQTVNVTGILATDVAVCDVSVSSTVATGVDQIDDWALISKIESGAGTLTFSCYEDKPTTELTVNVKVVR